MKARAFMRYSAHVSGGAPRSERSSADALRALILRSTRNSSPKTNNCNRGARIEHLKLLLAKLHRMQFGRKSEKLERQIEQLELRLEELESKRSEQEPNAPEPAPVKRLCDCYAAKPTRRTLPGHLPRQNTPARAERNGVPAMSGELRKLGEDISEMLEYVPASFV